MSHSATHATSSLPAPRRRITSVTAKDMDLEAIRERRSRLEALTASLRLPPLLPRTAERRDSTSSASSVMKHVKPRRRHLAERPPTSSRDPPPAGKQIALEARLPVLSLPPMTPYHNPLPDIGRTAVWETEEETEEDADEGGKEEDENPLHSVDSPPPPTYEETQQVSRWVEEINAQNLLFSRDGGSDGADASRQSAPTSGKRRTPTLNPEGIETQFTDLTSSGLEKRPATAASKGEGQSQEDDEVLKNEVKVRIQELVEQLKSDDPSVKLEAMVESRKLLSQEVDPPVQDFIDSGVLPLAIAAVKAENSELQYEATWVITNIASGTSEQTTAVVDHGAVPVLIELLGSPEVRLQEQAAWALGNISADSPGLRDQLVADGIVTPLMSSIKEDMPISFRRNLSWVLSNIFRYKGIDMPEEEKLLVLEELKHNLEKQDDFEVKSNSIWTLNYFMEQSDSHIQLVVEQGFVPLLVENIPDSQLQKVTVRCLGNILTGNDSQTEQVLEAGVLPLYLDILASSHSESVRKEVLWSLSNVTAGTATQVQRVVDAGLLPVLVDSVMQDSHSARTESLWALVNLLKGGTEDQARSLVKAGGVEAFVKELDDSSEKLTLQALNGLSALLQIPALETETKRIVRAADGLGKLDALFHSDNLDLIDKASKISSHFLGDDLKDGRSEGDDGERLEENGEETEGESEKEQLERNGEEMDGESNKSEAQEGEKSWQDKNAQKVQEEVDNQFETKEDKKEEEEEGENKGTEEGDKEEENKKDNTDVLMEENADLEGKEEQNVDEKNLQIPDDEEAEREHNHEKEIKRDSVMEDREDMEEAKEGKEGVAKMGDSDEPDKEMFDEAAMTDNEVLSNTDGNRDNSENGDNETEDKNNTAAVEPTLLDEREEKRVEINGAERPDGEGATDEKE